MTYVWFWREEHRFAVNVLTLYPLHIHNLRTQSGIWKADRWSSIKQDVASVSQSVTRDLDPRTFIQ